MATPVSKTLPDYLTAVYCLVYLNGMTLACEDANSKLVEVITVADAEDRVCCRFGS